MTARDDAIAAIREHDWQPAYGCRHGITHDYDRVVRKAAA